MAHYHVTRHLAYSPDQVFDLVGAVDAYPQFVPWITAMQVETLQPERDGRAILMAEAKVGFAFLQEAFTTRVTCDRPRRLITVSLISGPFKALHNEWMFRPDPKGCEVVFDIDFRFKTRVLDMLLKANFGYAVDRLIGCFEARARQLYGGGQQVSAAPTRTI